MYFYMPNLSSVTLFHFTDSLENLKSILKGGLRYGMFGEKLPIKSLAYFVRGISFCNIPLSMISEHVEWYGRYAIGLKRSAMRMVGVSPVFYIHSKTKTLPVDKKGFEDNPSLGFFKQYYGSQYHKIARKYKYKSFYNEKEWRVFSGKAEIENYSDDPDLDRIRKKKDRTVPEVTPLKITDDMIEYIILKSPDDFMEFDEFLKDEYKDKREILLTRILYYSQIKKDF